LSSQGNLKFNYYKIISVLRQIDGLYHNKLPGCSLNYTFISNYNPLGSFGGQQYTEGPVPASGLLECKPHEPFAERFA
jgi:hypothetical protein